MKSLVKGYGREKRLGYTALNNRLTDDGKVVSLIRRPRCTPLKDVLVLISVRGLVNPRAAMRLKGSGKLKNSIISLGLESKTFRPVA
jgi:hypothetical protein